MPGAYPCRSEGRSHSELSTAIREGRDEHSRTMPGFLQNVPFSDSAGCWHGLLAGDAFRNAEFIRSYEKFARPLSRPAEENKAIRMTVPEV